MRSTTDVQTKGNSESRVTRTHRRREDWVPVEEEEEEEAPSEEADPSSPSPAQQQRQHVDVPFNESSAEWLW